MTKKITFKFYTLAHTYVKQNKVYEKIKHDRGEREKVKKIERKIFSYREFLRKFTFFLFHVYKGIITVNKVIERDIAREGRNVIADMDKRRK